jgi:plastocyanin
MNNVGAWVTGLCLLAVVGCNRPSNYGPLADAVQVKKIRESFGGGATGGGGGEKAAAAVATGWANLRGSFEVAGDVAAPEKLKIEKDTEVCTKEVLVDESVMLGKGNTLIGAVLFVRNETVPVHESYEATAKAEITLDNRNCRFEPHVIAVRTSQTLVLHNSDPVLHNSKFSCVANPSPNVSISSGGNEAVKLTKSEKQPVKIGCSVHPWMGGVVVVRNDPYAVVAGKAGEFKMDKVPAGIELEFQVWHEKSPNGLKGVQIEGVKVDDKGRFKLKLNPDEDRELKIKIASTALK